jgi:hypothetical protein
MVRWRWILPAVQVALAVVLLARAGGEERGFWAARDSEAGHPRFTHTETEGSAAVGWDDVSCFDCPLPPSKAILYMVDFPAAALSSPFTILPRHLRFVHGIAFAIASGWFWFWAGRRIDWARTGRKVAPPSWAATFILTGATALFSWFLVGSAYSIPHGGLPALRLPLTAAVCVWAGAFAVFFGSRCLAGLQALRKRT